MPKTNKRKIEDPVTISTQLEREDNKRVEIACAMNGIKKATLMRQLLLNYLEDNK